jgi:hypothetical protein
MTDVQSQETSRLFDLNYVFEPRWGSTGFDDGDVLELCDLDEEVTVNVLFAEAKEVMLGRPATSPTNDLDGNDDENVEDFDAETTINIVPPAFRRQLMKLAAVSEEDRIRGEAMRDATMPVVDLQAFHADMYGVSRKHAVLERDERYITITDLRSTNGTRLNGSALFPMQRRFIRNGDEIQLGNLRLRVRFRRVVAER